jgi:hypothetical protein
MRWDVAPESKIAEPIASSAPSNLMDAQDKSAQHAPSGSPREVAREAASVEMESFERGFFPFGP